MHLLLSLLATLVLTTNGAVSSPITHNTSQSSNGTTINLGYATYEGSTNGLGINEFLGMRYAAPPLVNLRFRAPRDPLNETSIVKADAHGSICMSVIQTFVPSNPSSEDCLFIDVYTPSTVSPESKLPVVLWIQGGAYTSKLPFLPNSQSQSVNDNNNNMIVVTFNFRVGPYGFLASEAIRHDGDLNVGLLDQQKAMQWVQKHISSFGGNPAHVVLMGTSSGGGDVLHHLAAYAGNPPHPFVGAIASSSYNTHILPVQDLEFQYQDLLHATNCTDLSCLRALPTSAFQAANTARPYPSPNSNPNSSPEIPIFTYAPCIDGTFFPQHPISLFQNGAFAHVPLLLGNTANEGTIFGLEANSSAQVRSLLRTNYPELTNGSLSRIEQLYPYDAASQNVHHTPYFASASAAYGEGFFTCPSLDIARLVSGSASSAPVWDYRYNVRDPANVAAGLGVPHTWEIDAVWGPGFAVNAYGSNSYAGADASIVPVVQGYWQSFVRGLNPNAWRAVGSPEWRRFGGDDWLVIQTNGTRMERRDESEMARCRFWDGITDGLNQ
ncbi:putative secreted lipase [Lachnellula cervina]|uniref:Carboxylic ester hydrolase n=1 Tax=Lachnellula cervina TaxID=1316786 RepID=A0A7D8YR94_9HELO|nr:putative secreted lipase [Lachnellula cervina]